MNWQDFHERTWREKAAAYAELDRQTTYREPGEATRFEATERAAPRPRQADADFLRSIGIRP